MGQSVDGNDPDDLPPLSVKMTADRLRESRSRSTVVLLDIHDEEDDNLEEVGNGKWDPPVSDPEVGYPGPVCASQISG